MSNRQRHPQVIRAKELARAAGLNPYARVEVNTPNGYQHQEPTYSRFMDAAFDEHFAREAVDNIYWDRGGSFYTDRWDIPRRAEDCRLWYGRCKSGRRWFWQVGDYNREVHGWADTEEQALIAGTAAIKRFAAGRRAIVHYHHGSASYALKKINAAKRTKRWTNAPADGSDTHATEYLYDQYSKEFRITKKTAKRIYYVKNEDTYNGTQIGFAPRHKVADDWPGSSSHDLYKLDYRNRPDFFLKPQPPGYRSGEPPPEIDLRKLKAEMAAAHPDKGSSSAAFITARKAYETARRRAKAEADRG